MPRCRARGRNTGRPEALSAALLRKLGHLKRDPVLRRWLFGRLIGRHPAPPAFTPHRPPYLAGHIPASAPARLPALAAVDTAGLPPLALPLAGEDVSVAPGGEAALFQRPFADTETLLGLNRFAWLPLVGDQVDKRWVAALWTAWVAANATPDDGWPWHPYTAAERAINLLDYTARHGDVCDAEAMRRILEIHAEAIAATLEYGGEHNTSNHLANNGRGLYRIGLALGLDWAAEIGRDILLNEAERIFMPSGMLREGSSHYHLLYTQRYLDAWLVATSHARPEATALAAVAERALGVLAHLDMPGDLALIGDISPDQPPEFLAGLLAGRETGWLAKLSGDARNRILERHAAVEAADPAALRRDGWARLDHGQWSALWHAAPSGWPPMPGHGHQDLGSFELHFGGERVIVDPGRGSYGMADEASYYFGAEAHNLVTVDAAPPSPENRPYYDDHFRTGVTGAGPRMTAAENVMELAFDGFRRLGGVGTVTRRWSFTEAHVTLTDRVEGNRPARIARYLHVGGDVAFDGDAAVVTGRTGRFRIRAEGTRPELTPAKLWRAYGEAGAGTRISFRDTAPLPWTGEIVLEAI